MIHNRLFVSCLSLQLGLLFNHFVYNQADSSQWILRTQSILASIKIVFKFYLGSKRQGCLFSIPLFAVMLPRKANLILLAFQLFYLGHVTVIQTLPIWGLCFKINLEKNTYGVSTKSLDGVQARHNNCFLFSTQQSCWYSSQQAVLFLQQSHIIDPNISCLNDPNISSLRSFSLLLPIQLHSISFVKCIAFCFVKYHC